MDMESNFRGRFAQIWLAIAVIAGLAACGALTEARAQAVGGFTPTTGANSVQLPNILKDVRFDQKLGDQVPLDATFTDESGKTVTLSQYFGTKPVVLVLAYYRCPMLCSEVLSGTASALRQLGFRIGDQFSVLTISFDPTDTPAVSATTKQTYLKEYGDPAAAAGWHFLTGQKSQIDRVTDAVGFHYAYIPQTGQYAHAAGLVVLTPAGKVAQYFYGVRYQPQDLRLALVQSSQEKIGSVVDQILLYCCTYDPDTGKYHALISRVLQIAGGLTILLLGGAVFLLYRWDTKHRRPPTQAA